MVTDYLERELLVVLRGELFPNRDYTQNPGASLGFCGNLRVFDGKLCPEVDILFCP